MHIRRPALLGFFILLTLASVGQSADDFLKEAETAFASGDYRKAIGNYLMIRQIQPDNTSIFLPLAESYLRIGDPEPALPLLKAIVGQRRPEPRAFWLTGRALHLTAQYDLAVQAYKGYLQRTSDDDPLRDAVKADILRCGFGNRWQHSEAVAFVDNLGPMVNSDDDDLAPALSPNYPDRLYFSSNREGATGGTRNIQGLADPQGERKLDLYLTDRQPGGWSPPTPLPPLLNSAAHDIIQDMNADGSVLYFFKGQHMQAGQILTDTFSSGGEKALESSRFPGPVFAETGDIDLFFFNDSTALFAGRRTDGFGGTDLYILPYRNGQWLEPVNLGPKINTRWDERMPVLMADGVTLYFSSNHAKRSMGGFDIFQSAFDIGSRTWHQPVNLGAPICSPGDDLYFRPAPDGINAWLASNRPGGLGGFDLYAAFFKQPRLEQVSSKPVRSFFDILTSPPDERTLANEDAPLEKTPYSFKMIFFDTEEDITARQNQPTLDQAAALLNVYPDLQMAIQAHSDNTGTPMQYDLYYSIKRAERAREYLISKKGVSAGQISIQGFGPQYPQALESLQGKDNPQGRALNRRLHLTFLEQRPLPLLLSMDAPIISTFMRSSFGDDFVGTIEGLTWRVEIASAQGLYGDPAFIILPDLMAEQLRGGDRSARYCAGLFSTYEEAKAFSKTLSEKGLAEGKPHPYLNGIRMNEEEITSFLDTFPDLVRYLADRSK